MRDSFLRLLSISLLILFIPLLNSCASCTYFENSHFGEREDVQAFIQKISLQDNFNEQKLTELFNHVNPHPYFIQSEKNPHEKTMTWERYRARLITPAHVERGIEFWKEHQDTLQLAQQKYNVDPQIIIGILGVETDYGKYLGKYRVMDTLSTLSFNYHRRKFFFQNELEQYLLLTRELDIDPLSLRGSYAGAVGLPQFMPSNYRHLAVSKNGNTPDLWNNADDAILSVANYFHHKGWQLNQLSASQVSHSYNTLRFGNEYWQIYPNFIVIKRYNDSNFYAMAVYQLGETVKNRLNMT